MIFEGLVSGLMSANRSLPKPSSKAASQRMANTGQRDTSAELRIRKILFKMGLRYRVDYSVLRKPTRRADLAFIGPKVAVFVDGCFWHGCPIHGTWPKSNADFWRDKIETNRRRDLDTNQRLEKNGWKVIRVWEHDDLNEVATRIAKAVRIRKLGPRST